MLYLLLVTCHSSLCGFVAYNNNDKALQYILMSIYKTQAQFFSEMYDLDETPWPEKKPTPAITRFFKEKIRKEIKSGKSLDIGCGEGRHTLFFSQNNFFSVGIDYTLKALKKAPRGKKHNLCYINTDIFNLPFKKNSFDIILDSGCFHHVRKSDQQKYLNFLDHLLTKNGFYILTCFSYKFRHANEKKRNRDWLVHKGHYDRFFTKKTLYSIFRPQFNILQIEEEFTKSNAFYHVLCKKRHKKRN